MHGTGNVFADPGLPDAAKRQTKTRLAMAINGLFKARKLRQIEAGRLLKIPQSNMSALVNYCLHVLSVERLIAFFTALDQDAETMIRPSRTQGEGHVSVLAVR